MEKLPRDIALDILSRLPIVSLIQIKCVCRTWRSLAREPRLATMFHARAINTNPGLILHCDNPICNELYFVCTENVCENYTTKAIRIDAQLNTVMTEFQVVGSCNGLLCISDALHFDPVLISNPFTGDFVELPRSIQYPDQKVAFGFGYHPITMQYKLVRIAYYQTVRQHSRIISCTLNSNVHVLTIGTDSWRSIGDFCWRLEWGPSEAMLNGALHWVTTRYIFDSGSCLQIVSFDLAEEKFIEIGRPACGSLDTCNFHLVVLGGCLSAAVCCEGGGMEIWVMEEYKVESWTKYYVIGPYVPCVPSQNIRASSRRNRTTLGKGDIKVLCIMKNGQILLQYESGGLVCYDPECGEFKDVFVSGLPNCFSAITHVESLYSVEEIRQMQP